MPDLECRTCTFATGRHPGCQSTCEYYIKYRAAMDKKKLAREKALGVDRYRMDVTIEIRDFYVKERKRTREYSRR